MENNNDWIDETLNEITGHESDSAIDEDWMYPYACSSAYVMGVARTLLLLCQNPVKGLVLEIMDQTKDKDIPSELIPRLLDYYYSEFLLAIPLPLSGDEETSEQNANKENCHALREDLEENGPERLRLMKQLEGIFPTTIAKI